MWVTIAFMPFMFLGFVIGDKMKNFDSMKIFEHYIKAAFLPAAVAVPFAAGFLILTEITQVSCPTIAGPLCADTGPLLTNVNTLWGILMLLISFFIIWFGFWAALSIDTIYTSATSGIRSFGSSIGKTALKLPLSVPIIPTGGGESMSILGIDDAIGRLNSGLSSGMSGKDAFKAAAGGGKGGATATAEFSKVLNSPSNAQTRILTDIRAKLGVGNKFNQQELTAHLGQRGNGSRSAIDASLKKENIDISGLNDSEVAKIILTKVPEFQKATP